MNTDPTKVAPLYPSAAEETKLNLETWQPLGGPPPGDKPAPTKKSGGGSGFAIVAGLAAVATVTAIVFSMSKRKHL